MIKRENFTISSVAGRLTEALPRAVRGLQAVTAMEDLAEDTGNIISREIREIWTIFLRTYSETCSMARAAAAFQEAVLIKAVWAALEEAMEAAVLRREQI